MRVLMLAHNVAWQGSAIRALSLARPLARSGHEVTVLAARRGAGLARVVEVVDGVRLVQPPDVAPRRIRNGGLSPIDCAARITYLGRRRYDVVHAFEQRPCSTIPALVARRLGGAVLVADWADLWGPEGMAAEWPAVQRWTLGRLDGRWQSYTRRRADAVTAISRDLAGRAIALGVPPERVRLLPVGANDDVFAPSDPIAARRALGVPADARVVVHTGFAPFDDRLLAQTFAELARREPRAWLLTTGRRVQAVDEAAAAVGARDRVRQLGDVKYAALGTVMASGDLMLLPYTRRPHNAARFPNRLGDYLAAGRPVVTNATGDLGRLVADERVGLLAPEHPAGFAEVLDRLLDAQRLRAAMGARARRLAETRLSWRTLASGLEALYGELAESR